MLSALLFYINMKLLGEVIRWSWLSCHQHAKDTRFCLTLPSDAVCGMGAVVDSLNRCQKVVMSWMRANKLMLSSDKMEKLLVGPNSFLDSEISPVPDGSCSPPEGPSTQLLDPCVISSTFYQFRLICHLHHFLEKNKLVSVIHAWFTVIMRSMWDCLWSHRKSILFGCWPDLVREIIISPVLWELQCLPISLCPIQSTGYDHLTPLKARVNVVDGSSTSFCSCSAIEIIRRGTSPIAGTG